MAIRKATIKEQVAQAIAQANPGDRPHVTIATISGPSPWLTNALGLIGQLLVKFYFITVTDQAVVFHRINRFTQRPQEVVYAIPRDQAQGLLGDVQRNPLWSSFRFLLPGEMQPTRLNVHRLWREEMDQLIAMLAGAPQGFPAQGVPPQGQASYGAPAPAPHSYAAPAPQPYGAPAAVPQQPYQQHGAPAPQPGTSSGAPHTPMQGNPYAN